MGIAEAFEQGIAAVKAEIDELRVQFGQPLKGSLSTGKVSFSDHERPPIRQRGQYAFPSAWKGYGRSPLSVHGGG